MQPPPIKDYVLNNILAGETNSREQETPTRGNYFYILEATHSQFSLQINDGPKLRGKLARGHRFPDEFEIEKIRVYNESGTSQILSVVLQVGKGEPLDNVFNVTSDVSGPLTDAQLRASVVPVSVSGVATAANQTTANNSLSNIDADIGTTADAEATGNGSMIAILKRVRTLLGLTKNAGAADANTLRTITATDDLSLAALGTTADAEATANGSIIAILKRLRTLLGAFLSVKFTATGTTYAVSSVAATASFTIPAGTQSLRIVNGTGGTGVNWTAQFSTDAGTTWVPLTITRKDVGSSAPITTGVSAAITGQAMHETDVAGLEGFLFRLNVTAVTGTLNIYVVPLTTPCALVSITGASTLPSLSTRTSANTADGATTYHHAISAATTNATSVKGSGAQISLAVLCNASASARFVKFYNKATAPTVGTDTPILTVSLPPNSPPCVIPANGWTRFSTGIAYAITGAMPVADTTAVAANDVSVHITYT